MAVTDFCATVWLLAFVACANVTWCSPVHHTPVIPEDGRKEVCYSAHGVNLGCFDNSSPFDDLPLPWNPREIDPGFYLFTRENRKTEDVVRMDLNLPIPPQFKTEAETKIIIHGFMSSWESTWMHKMKDELLTKGDYNVILVDWRKGAQVPLFMYENSASNIRVVSAYLAKLMDMVAAETGYDMSKTHCIGHSLGAQTCGFFGKRVSNTLGRITGLDPAGPNFKDKSKEGRLDQSDADFVDNIHSNGEDSNTMDFGIGQQVGDVDFVPNGGGIQPGCQNRKKRSEESSSSDSPKATGHESCSHSRAYLYFIESINSDCPFLAVPCPNMAVKSKGECRSCSGNDCQRMGYYSVTRPGRGVYYTETNSQSPFCLG